MDCEVPPRPTGPPPTVPIVIRVVEARNRIIDFCVPYVDVIESIYSKGVVKSRMSMPFIRFLFMP